MKKIIFFVIAVISSLLSFAYFNSSKTFFEYGQDVKKIEPSVINQVEVDTAEFVERVSELNLFAQIEDFKEIVSLEDPESYEKVVAMYNSCDVLVQEFGTDQIFEILTVLTNADGENGREEKCCKRNANGTTNWSCCNFWESVAVLIKAYGHCQDGGPGASQSMLEEYYNCIQSLICKTC